MRFASLFILFLFALLSLTEISFAAALRQVEVEWEPIDDAVSYDVEFLTEENKSVALKVDEVREAKCRVSIEPGSYQVRVRSRDERGLVGRWGDPQMVLVPEFPIVIKSPQEGEAIHAENNIGIVTLKWEFARTSGSFPIEIQVFAIRTDSAHPVEDRPVYSTTTSGQSAIIELPVGSTYDARLISKSSSQSELAKVRFQVVGRPLDAPEISQVLYENRPFLSFSRPEGAETINLRIQGLDQKDGQFKLLEQKELKDQMRLSIDELPRNRPLLIQARAESKVRAASSNQTFFLEKDLLAQPESTEIAPTVFRRSASANVFAKYNLSSADYVSQSFEKSSVSTSKGITGTLVLGGEKFTSSGVHGISSQFEFGGLTVENSNYTFVRAQVKYVFRKSLLLPLELRGGAGVRYANLPEINRLSDNSISGGTMWSAGPHFHLDLWYQLIPRIALQTEVSASIPFFGKASNNAKIESGMSYQYSLKVAYSLSPHIIASVGLLASDELLKAPGKNPVGNFSGENLLQIRSLGSVACIEWSLP
jgi:hypothetical protein